MKLEIMSLKFILKARDNIKLPEHPGSTLRGAFGHGLKEVACNLPNEKCKECNLNNNCAYSLLFNPFLLGREKKKTSNRFNNKPRPFVFEPLIQEEKVFKSQESIEFKLNLFGYSKDFLAYIIEAWKQLENQGIGLGRGKFILEEVWVENNIVGSKQRIYSKQFGFDNSSKDLINKSTLNKLQNCLNKKKILLRFLTPVLLKHKGDYVEKITFYKLMKNLFRRLSSLSVFYGKKQLDIDFNSYLEKAKDIKLIKDTTNWESWYRYSNRQNKKIKMKGLVGEVVYEGNLEEFLSYLILGQYTHVGKNTVFGLGDYKLINN